MIAVAVALLRSFSRDRGALALAFVAPLAFFALLAIFYRHLDSPSGVQFSIGIVAPARDDVAPFVDALVRQQAGRIRVVRSDSTGVIEGRDEIDGVVTLPPDFSLAAPQVAVEARSPLPGVSDVMRYLVTSAFAETYGTNRPGIAVEDRSVGGRLLRANVSAIPVMFILFATSSLAARGLGDDEAGFAERLQSLGLSRRRRTLARWLALTAIALAQMLVTLAVAAVAFGIVPADPIALLVAAVAAAMACTAFVVALAEFCGTRARFSAISPVATLALAGLGGSMVPTALLPPSLAWPARWLFTGWSIDACAAAVDGVTAARPVLLLVAFTAVMLVIATGAERGRVAR